MPKRPFDPNEEKKPLLPVEEMECCSDTEMTGLIPANPVESEKLAAYQEIFPYLPADTDDGTS